MAVECKTDTSETAKINRKTQYENISKLYPQSFCTDDQMSDIVKSFYKSYIEYPIDLIGCPDRDKAFIIDKTCSNFKYLPKDTYPDKSDDEQRYITCMATYSPSECADILGEISNKQLDHTIQESLDSCDDQHGGGCGVYAVNNYKYEQDTTLKYGLYAIPISVLCFSSSCCIICVLCLLIILM